MAFANHKFCWHGIVSTDVERAKAFYPEVLGWQVEALPMGEDEATFFAVDGARHAHLSEPQMEGVPSHWDNYLRVEDVDAKTAAAVANGGAQVVPPTDIPPGRFSVVTSPSGASLVLFKEADPADKNLQPADGRIHWTELHSTDLASDITWLKATFGYAIEDMPMPTGTYHILKDGDESCGGAMASLNTGAPSMWLTWVQVADVDSAAQRVTGHGGQLLGEVMDMPGVGRMVVAADPTGGVFGLITPST